MRILKSIAFIVLILSCAGCATQRGWRYSADAEKHRTPLINKTVAVTPFKDARPDKNNNALMMYLVPIVPVGWCDYSTPEGGSMKLNSSPVWLFRPTEDLAKAAAEELQASGIFKEVFYTQRGSDGDLEFLGTVNSTRYSGTVISYGLSAYGPLLWLFGLPCGSVENDLAVEFRIVDHSNNRLWSNKYTRSYKKSPIFIYSLPSDFQYDSLYKEIMVQAVGDLEGELEKNKTSSVEPQAAEFKQQNKPEQKIKEPPAPKEAPAVEVKKAPEPQPSMSSEAAAVEAKKIEQPRASISSYAEYNRFLYKTISQAVVRPAVSGSGVVNVVLTLLPDGSIDDIQILESSSGDPAFGEAVLNAIKSTAPYPAFSPDMEKEGKKIFTLSIDFKYKTGG